MKKMELAGSQLTTNQDENTGIKVLNRFYEKVTPQVIDAEGYYARISRTVKPGIFIDCDTVQEVNDYSVRYGCIGKPLTKIIEV